MGTVLAEGVGSYLVSLVKGLSDLLFSLLTSLTIGITVRFLLSLSLVWMGGVFCFCASSDI